MRVFAWSDLHLEHRSNAELVKQFCKLHQSPSAFVSSDPHDIPSLPRCSNYTEAGVEYANGLTTTTRDNGAMQRCSQISGGVPQSSLENYNCLNQNSLKQDFSRDVLLLAGDVHYNLWELETCLILLKAVFKHVAFIPGNHELWITKTDKSAGIGDSIRKLDAILELCRRLEVHTLPFRPSKELLIIPLLSWYDEYDVHFHRLNGCAYSVNQVRPASTTFSFLQSSDSLFALAENWMDYGACKWPLPLKSNYAPVPDTNNNDCPEWRVLKGCHTAANQVEIHNAGTSSKQDVVFKMAKAYEPHPCLMVTSSPPPSKVAQEKCKGAPFQRDLTRQLLTPTSSLNEKRSSITEDYAHSANGSETYRSLNKRELNLYCATVLENKRRFTDCFGMPFSLSEFFAEENRARGVFSNESSRRSAASDCKYGARNKISCQQVCPRMVDKMNAVLIAVYELEKAAKTTEETVITFSHFLPRSDLLALTTSKPPALIHVMGSSKIDEQLRELASDIHVFGHSHENVDTVIDGVRYIQNSLGTPSEQQWFPERRQPKLIFEGS